MILAALSVLLIAQTTIFHEGTKTGTEHDVQVVRNVLRDLRDPSCLCDESSQMTNTAAPRTIEKGDQSNIDAAKQVLVRTEEEWTALWNQHSPDRPKPRVDFSKEMVVGVFMGSRSNSGFSTAITLATTGNGVLIVRYTETVPRPGAITAQVITFPFHLVAIPKADVKEMKFEKVGA